MAPHADPKKRYTVEEYLELERRADERHEFFQGEIFAMTGGTRRHTQIAINLAGELRAALRSRPCLVLGADMRISVTATGLYTYPGLVVVCGAGKYTDDREDSLENPGVIVEVLSPTTESYDRGRKFEQYRTISSLTDYILVSQDTPLVEHFVRQASGSWLLTERRSGDLLTIESLGVAVPVDEVYLKVFDVVAS